MDRETIIAVSVVMLLLLVFINFVDLYTSFKKIKVDSENKNEVKTYKRKWSLILFTDIIFYYVMFYIFLLAKVKQGPIISLFLAFIYMGYIDNKMKKSAIEIFGSTRDTNRVERYSEVIINTNDDGQASYGVGTRKLTIKRIKALFAALVKIHVFIETDEVEDDSSCITAYGNRYKLIGSIPYGKAIIVNIPQRSVRMLVCTFFYLLLRRYPTNIKRFTITSGEDDIVLNIKPGPSPGVPFLIEKDIANQ